MLGSELPNGVFEVRLQLGLSHLQRAQLEVDVEHLENAWVL